ncbi:MAG: porin [Phycisphaerales bacterium]
MNLTKQVGLVVGAAALTLTGGSFADTTPEANTDLKAQLNDALARIDQLEAKQNDNWLTEQRADEIRGLVQDVLADADTRASLLAQGVTAGYDNGAVISSADGNWSLRTNIHMQQRFVWNNQDEGSTVGLIDEDRYGFENTRTKFILTGNVVNQQWIYKVEINVGSPSATAVPGLVPLAALAGVGADSRAGTGDAYLGYKYDDGLTVLFGTMKAPLLREELVDSRYQLAVERSALNYLFTGGRMDGVALDWMGDQFHITGAFSDGIRTGQTVWATPTTDFAFTGRVEYLASGTWDQFSDFTSPAGDEQGIMIGGALHFQESEDDAGLADVDILVLTADVSAEFGGANLFAAFIYTDIDAAGLPAVNPLGFLVQGGVALSDDWEAFARYEFSDFDVTGIEDLSLITFGVTRYFAGHNAKWTTDVGIGLEEVLLAPAITGLRTDAPGEDSQVVIRSQIQLVF